MSDKISIQEILMKQFEAAGDTQFMNKNDGIDARYSVNRRWLNNFAKLIVEAVVDKCAEEAEVDYFLEGHPEDSGYACIHSVDSNSILKVKKLVKYE